jgi:hypothetical protein
MRAFQDMGLSSLHEQPALEPANNNTAEPATQTWFGWIGRLIGREDAVTNGGAAVASAVEEWCNERCVLRGALGDQPHSVLTGSELVVYGFVGLGSGSVWFPSPLHAHRRAS